MNALLKTNILGDATKKNKDEDFDIRKLNKNYWVFGNSIIIGYANQNCKHNIQPLKNFKSHSPYFG